MSRFNSILCVFALSLAFVVSAAGPLRAEKSSEQVATEIAAARNSFLAAYDARSPDQLANLFADKAYFAGVVLPRWYDGRDKIRQGWAAFFQRFDIAQIEFPTQGRLWVSDDGSVATETGCLRMRMEPPVPAIVNEARYSATRQFIGGQWLITNLHVSEPTGAKLQKIEDPANCFDSD